MSDSTIKAVKALEILDSRGNPTLQVTVSTEKFSAKASVPSGVSTGVNEALELRDGDQGRYFGKGVFKAIKNVEGPLAELLVGQNIFAQRELDKKMCEADGTENKSSLGANAILGVSLAIAKTAAKQCGLPLYHYIGGAFCRLLPCPMMNVINGGVHADNSLEFQEFMIRPLKAPSFSRALQVGAEIFHTLKMLLKEKGYTTSVGDEGGFAPRISSNEEALDFIVAAIEKAGYQPGSEVSIALDCAASEFYHNHTYNGRSSEEQITLLEELCKKYPIDSIEDGLSENDWEAWTELTKRLGARIQIVGDDLFVTNKKFLSKGLEKKSANSILIKVNQIGTLTETMDCISLAKAHGYTTIISHRSGETEDTTIADLAVGSLSGQIKTGSLSRSDRVSKYNRLLEIEAELGETAFYRDSNLCRHLGRT